MIDTSQFENAVHGLKRGDFSRSEPFFENDLLFTLARLAKSFNGTKLVYSQTNLTHSPKHSPVPAFLATRV